MKIYPIKGHKCPFMGYIKTFLQIQSRKTGKNIFIIPDHVINNFFSTTA
jgi:hypothetical protein